MAAPLRHRYGLFLHVFSSNSRLSRHVPVTLIENACSHCNLSRGNISRARYGNAIAWNGEILPNIIGVKGSICKGDNYCKSFSRNSSETKHLVRSLCILDNCNVTFTNCSRQLFFQNGSISNCHRTYCNKPPVEGRNNQDDLQSDNRTENIYTIPNLLTLSRVVLTPVIGVLVVQQSFPAALALFTFAGVTDWLDGYIARNFKNQMSTFGTAMDPLADKILVSVLTVTLTMANLLPVPLAVVILGRDVLLVASGFVIRYMSLPPPFTLRRYFDGTIPTVKLSPSALSKVNTSLQLSLVCFTLAAPVFGFVDHPVLQCLWYVTAATTIGSGVDYVINRHKYVKFLKLR